MSAVTTLVAMAFSQYLIVRYFWVQELGLEGVPLFGEFDLVLDLIVESIKSDVVILLFWGIALLGAFAVPAKRTLRHA